MMKSSKCKYLRTDLRPIAHNNFRAIKTYDLMDKGAVEFFDDEGTVEHVAEQEFVRDILAGFEANFASSASFTIFSTSG